MNVAHLFSSSHGVCRPWRSFSRARVAFYPGEGSRVEYIARRLFGRTLRRWEYASLAGAPDDAEVAVGTLDGALYLETCRPVTNCYRAVWRICRTRSGLIVTIDAFHILRSRMRRRGLGLQILSRQLVFAKYLGARRADTTAGRQGSENGYYTWPRFGFNGPLPPEIRQKLPPRLAHARTVLDLIESEAGRLWWREHGVTLDVVFDLTDGSRSWQVLRRYLNSRLPSAEAEPARMGDSAPPGTAEAIGDAWGSVAFASAES